MLNETVGCCYFFSPKNINVYDVSGQSVSKCLIDDHFICGHTSACCKYYHLWYSWSFMG